MVKLDALIQAKIDEDKDFQASLADLSDDEKSEKLNEKRSEILENEYSSWKDTSTKHSKSEELAKNYKTRAEKAETELKKFKPPDDDKSSKKDDDALSYRDHYALTDAKVHVDDVDWVVKQAKLAGKSVAVTLKDEEVQTILKIREEKRKTADAANTKPARPGAKKSGAQLARQLSEGKAPDPGSDEAEALFWERRGGKTRDRRGKSTGYH